MSNTILNPGVIPNTSDAVATLIENAVPADLARIQASVSGGASGEAGPIVNEHGLSAVASAVTAMFATAGRQVKVSLQIANCEFWTDAATCALKADNTPATTTGNLVATLIDASGNARHATVVAGGSPTYDTNGYRGRPGVTGRMVTPGFVASGMGTNLTMITVRKAIGGTGFRIASSIGTNFYDGYNGTTLQRSHTWTGLVPGSNSNQTAFSDGIGVMGISSSEARSLMGGVGWTSSSSEAKCVYPITSGAVAFANTELTIGGYPASAGFDWLSPVSEVIVYGRYLTDDEIRRVYGYLVAKYETTPLVVCVGNSLTAGTGSTSGPTQSVTTAGDNWPSQLLMALNGSARVITDAYPGRTNRQIASETPRFSRLLGDGIKTVYAVWEITNEMATYGSPFGAYQQLVDYCRSLRTPTRNIVVLTILKRGDVNIPKNSAYTDQVNALIRANWASFADALADVAAHPSLSDFNNVTYYNVDKTHLTTAGYAIVAAEVAAVVATMLA